jgi:fluoride exporter
VTAVLLVFIGAGLGGTLRHGVNILATHLFGAGFPMGTLLVNVIGSLIIGAMAGWLAFHATQEWSMQARLFVVTGILGGFTTFSSFSLDAVLLFERGEIGLAALYIGASVALSLVATIAGLAAVRALT